MEKGKIRNNIFFISSIVLLVGLVMSKFLLSVGIWGIVAAGLISNDYSSDWKRFWSNKAYLATIGIFLILLLSGINTENWSDMTGRLRIAIPYLVLPLAFGMMPPISSRQYKTLLYIFVALMTAASIWVLGNYLLNFDEIQYALKGSKALPTPQDDHIRFSLTLCIAIFAGAWLYAEKFYLKFRKEHIVLLLAIIFMWVMLHVLAVRSGLLAFYMGIFVWIIQLILVRRQWLLGLGLFMGMFLIPIAAYYTVPSFRMKVHLTRYNWEQFQQGNIADLSDTQRLLSYQIALKVAAKNPIFGVGIGDLEDEQRKVYELEYPEQRVMYPHNQFLSFYVGAGWVGLLAFLGCFFFPFFYKKAYRDTFFLLFFTVIGASFLTENTIFIAVGTAIHCFFLLLNLKMSEDAVRQSSI